MAFRNPGLIGLPPIITPPRPGGIGGVPVAPAVDSTNPNAGPGASSSTPPPAPESAFFGGYLPKSAKGAEKKEQLEGDARRFESFHQPFMVDGPLVMAAYATSGVSPIAAIPGKAQAAFSLISRAGAQS